MKEQLVWENDTCPKSEVSVATKRNANLLHCDANLKSALCTLEQQ